MDRNGYNPSILQFDTTKCFLCGRSTEKLDRHEIFGGPFRSKSKALGLWVTLCHQTCHLNRVHAHPQQYVSLKQYAQREAMREYGWDTADFIQEIGRNYL